MDGRESPSNLVQYVRPKVEYLCFTCNIRSEMKLCVAKMNITQDLIEDFYFRKISKF